ncbi:MAG: peptidyl-prolyl cis-trans isomerase [Candidatus Dependentiae bacterium]
MDITFKKHFCLSLLLAPLVFLSGCLPGDDKTTAAGSNSTAAKSLDDGSEVLLTIDGRPVITLNSLNAEFDRLLEESPQLAQVLPFMPDAKSNFLQGMVNQEVVDYYISNKGLDRTPEYVQEFEKTMDQVKKMLNTKYFGEKHPVKVSEAEVRAFYEENKNKLPDLMISQGGVKAEGVSFNKEDDAKAFLAKAKEGKADFEKVAKDAGFADNYRDFKMVNNQSLAIDPALRSKLVSLNRFPTNELVKVGDMWWVVKAHSKEEPKYRPLDDQLKPSLEEYLKKQKQMELFEKVIDGYKKEFNVIVNDEPLKPKAGEKADNPLAQMMAAQEETVAANETPERSAVKELADVQPATQTV